MTKESGDPYIEARRKAYKQRYEQASLGEISDDLQQILLNWYRLVGVEERQEYQMARKDIIDRLAIARASLQPRTFPEQTPEHKRLLSYIVHLRGSFIFENIFRSLQSFDALLNFLNTDKVKNAIHQLQPVRKEKEDTTFYEPAVLSKLITRFQLQYIEYGAQALELDQYEISLFSALRTGHGELDNVSLSKILRSKEVLEKLPDGLAGTLQRLVQIEPTQRCGAAVKITQLLDEAKSLEELIQSFQQEENQRLLPLRLSWLSSVAQITVATLLQDWQERAASLRSAQASEAKAPSLYLVQQIAATVPAQLRQTFVRLVLQ